MRRVIYRRKALADIKSACEFSETTWGPAQRMRYEQIIVDAAQAVAMNPTIGRPRPEIAADARSLFIRRPGKNASHTLYYFVGADGNIYVVRLLHAAQDPGRHLSDDQWR